MLSYHKIFSIGSFYAVNPKPPVVMQEAMDNDVFDTYLNSLWPSVSGRESFDKYMYHFNT